MPAKRLAGSREGGEHDRRGIAALEQVEALGRRAPGRRRVEDCRAAERCPLAEDDAVAAGGDHRRGEPQLRAAGVDADDPRHVLGGAVVDVEVRAVGDLRQRSEGDVEAVAERVGAGLHEGVAAPELGALDPGERDRDALPGLGALDRPVVDLDAADADVEAGRLGAERVPLADRAGPERPCDDGTDAAQREDPVDEEARRPRDGPRLDLVGRVRQRCQQLLQPLTGRRARRHDRRGRGELPRLRDGELASLRVDRIHLGDRDYAVLDPEQLQDRQVLTRLRAGAFAGVDDQEEEVDPGRAGDHRAHEALVARHVDEGEAAPVGQLERGVAEVDGDAAPLLLRQAVGVLPRQGSDEPGLAVVDVARCADRQRQRATASAASSTSASVSVRQSSRSRSSRTTPTTAGLPRRSGSASSSGSAHAQLGISVSGSDPPPGRAVVSTTAPPVRSARRSARARTASAGSASIRRHREVAAPGAVEGQCAVQRRQRQLVGAQRALQRMPAHALDQVGAADRDPRLWPAQELVAGERHDVCAVLERGRDGRLVPGLDERAGAEVLDERQAVALGELRQVGRAGLLREPDHAEVRLVDPQERRSAVGEGVLEVGEPRPVRRADLDEGCTGARQDVRDPEAVADLDQLSAGDDHLPALRQGGDGEQDGGGVVVDDDRRLRAGQLAQRGGEMVLPGASASGLEVVFEVRIAGADLMDPRQRRLRERGPTEVRVDDDSRGVEDTPQPRADARLQLADGALDRVAGRKARLHVFARVRERRLGRRLDERAAVLGHECFQLLPAEQLVDRGQLPQWVRGGHERE